MSIIHIELELNPDGTIRQIKVPEQQINWHENNEVSPDFYDNAARGWKLHTIHNGSETVNIFLSEEIDDEEEEEECDNWEKNELDEYSAGIDRYGF